MNIKQRNPIVAVILSLVTCGIYGIYWTVCLAREAVSVKDPADNGLLEIILCLFLSPVGFYLAEQKLAEGCKDKAIDHKDNGILYLVLGFVGLGIVNYILMQNDINKVADILNP